MLREETGADHAFRMDARVWLAQNLDPSLRDLPGRPDPERMLNWCRRLHAKGWLVPHWPRAYGGSELTPVQQLILYEEQARAGVPEISLQGINHIGPILIRFGSEDQKRRHLPPILDGKVIWCQGYSEPGAGSDLAGLRTRAVVDGDHLVINGSKIWTTWGHYAHWMFALVRTSAPELRRNAITFVLIDMASPGITRRPIKTIAGEDELAEIFFDNVRVPIENVVLGIGQGWAVATELLNEERLRGSNPSFALKALWRLRRLAAYTGIDRDLGVRDRLAALEIEAEAVSASYLDLMETVDDSNVASADSSFIKIIGTEVTQRITEAMQELAGPLAAVEHSVPYDGRQVDFSGLPLQARRLSILGGTNEIQRSLIASRVLQLPRGGTRA
ncbi:MAG: acyl-CoA dehydrogenase family protein [Pseudorhodoplanes sp.]|jgi:alkylation response protein AidB-like acyl-CoA dehydrogenase|nr:acyl-CoA dehydrogenase family protein [Pseudorhodoplanes sp.]